MDITKSLQQMSVSQNETVAFSSLYREITWIFVLYFKHSISDAQKVLASCQSLNFNSASLNSFAL